MRELEREKESNPEAGRPLAIIGPGRVGRAVAAAASSAGLSARLAGRDEALDLCRRSESALLCVPDSEIAAACRAIAAAVPPLRFVGHTSGATGLSALEAAGGRGARLFSLHPLQTITAESPGLAGAPCAVSGSDEEAMEHAAGLAESLGMAPFAMPEGGRAAYHAAASIASNFLVALEESAAEVMEAAGVEGARRLLAPLVLRSARNWAEHGAAALTGPIARGDEETVAHHLEALAEADPPVLDLYRVMAARTRAIAGDRAGPSPSKPLLLRDKAGLRAALAAHRASGSRVGLVPTMGALHRGHLSLLRRARRECDVVVMSLFVNPAQFGEGEDLSRYPRDEGRDVELASSHGVDFVYAPSPAEVYPAGFSTGVEVTGLSEVLCGDPARRGPEHFRGVATVVAKLFNSVRPHTAYFGQKDAQQAAVIRRMNDDLDFDVRIEVLPTVREADGLALSSRNAYLRGSDRDRAAALYRALRAAESGTHREGSLGAGLRAARHELAEAGIEPEYLEARDAESLEPVERLNGRPVLVAVAAEVGGARLIDNIVVEPAGAREGGD
ncbi:MAG: pantoate--beta-alanine ligase [Solirubrobacterales bacterium]